MSEPEGSRPESPHASTVEAVTTALGVDPDIGLADKEVERRRARFGWNRLGEGRRTPW
jgi:hypothetical protein